MPAYHQKEAVLDGRASVFSYERDPSSWYYKQLIPGTKKYRTRKIQGVRTLEGAKSKALEIAFQLGNEPIAETKTVNRSKKVKQVRVKDAVNSFLAKQSDLVETGEFEASTLKSKTITLRVHLLNYLSTKSITYTKDIRDDSLDGYPVWRKRNGCNSKLTLQKELGRIKEFINNYLISNKLVTEEVVLEKKITPTIKVSKDELTANPSLTNKDWVVFNRRMREKEKRTRLSIDPRHNYWSVCFWIFAMTLRHSGCRPCELMKLKFRDIQFENIGRKTSRGIVEEMVVAHLFIHRSKSGAARTVPTNKNVARRLLFWIAYVNNWWFKQKLTRKIEPTDSVFGRANNNMEAYHYSVFEREWRTTRNYLTNQGWLEGSPYSDDNYTLYSLRSTYIENQLLNGIDIHTVARVCGHSVAVLERYYERMDIKRRTRELTQIDFGSPRDKMRVINPYDV